MSAALRTPLMMPQQQSLPTRPSILHQFDQFSRAYLQLKLRRFLLLLVAAIPLASGAYLSAILGSCDLTFEADLKFYGSADIASAWQLLADRKDKTATSLAVSRGEHWPKQGCSSAQQCASEIFSRVSPVLAWRVMTAKSTPAMLECFAKRPSDGNISCTFLYQLTDTQPPALATLGDLRFFRFTHVNSENSSGNAIQSEMRIQLKHLNQQHRGDSKSAGCSISSRLFQVVVAISFSIGTMTIIIYFTVSTLHCIARLKQDGFLQLQYRCGMRAAAYWLPVWSVTFAECCALSCVFFFGQVFHCPEFAQSRGSLGVFAMFLSYCASVAALAILAATVQAAFNASCMLMMLLNIVLITGFAYVPMYIRNGPASVTYLFPPINTLQYIMTYMSSDGSGDHLSASEAAHYRRMLPCSIATPIILAIVTVYLDFILPDGNGLCLPAYYPFTRRFWLPPNRRQDGVTRMRLDSNLDRYVESVPDSTPLVVVDSASVVYNRRYLYGSCCQTKALNRLSCEVYPGQITWLLGGKGSGKSTLLSLLGGSGLTPICGSVTLDGCQATGPLDRLSLRHRIGVAGRTSGDGICSCLTVWRCLALTQASRGAGTSGRQQPLTPRDLLGRLGLAGLEDATPTDLTPGQRRLLRLGLALIEEPELLLLDEPTRGLDPAASQRVWRLLRDICPSGRRSVVGSGGGGTLAVVVAVSDDHWDRVGRPPGDRVLLLSDGRVAGAGSPQFLWRALGCARHRLIGASLLSPPADDDDTRVVEELLARLPPDGARLLPESQCGERWAAAQFEQSRRLRLLVEPDLLADCVAALEAAADQNLIVSDEIRLLRPALSDALLQTSGVTRSPNRSPNTETAQRHGGNNSNYSDSDAPRRHSRELSEVPTLAADSTDASRLEPSALRRLRALWLVNIRRQVRSKPSLLARLIAPSLMLVGLALLTVQGRFHLVKTSSSWNRSDDEASLTTKHVQTACVYDDAEGQESALRYRHCMPPHTLKKAVGIGLSDFLTQSGVIDKLRASCWTRSSVCLVVYPGAWNRSARDHKQGVTIGLLEFVDAHHKAYSRNELVNIYRAAVAEIAGYYGLQSTMKEPELTYNLDQGHCMHFEIMVLLFATIFSVFPASFMEDPSEDIETGVYKYLSSIGTSTGSYWIHTFIVHWFQYAIYFLLLVGVLEVWDQFRNPYYITCVCLPVLFLGTASNQLSVYTSVATSRSRNATVKFSYYCLVLSVPWALHGVAKLGRIPVLAMIWLVPQAAPVALILFGMRLAGQRTLDVSDESIDRHFIHQAWDLQSTLWSNVFVVNSMVAMPVHLILLSLALAALECNFSKLLDRVREALRSPVGGSGSAAGDSHLLGAGGEELPMTLVVKETADDSFSGLYGRSNVLQVRDLWKTCASTGLPVLRGVSFDLALGDTMILLGPDDAAKSATAAIAAGAETQISGHCRVLCECDLCSQLAERTRHHATCGAVGYCPSYSPLLDWLTVSEHLRFYARVRGVPTRRVWERVWSLLDRLGLRRKRRWMVGRLSDECRRRLCLAVALLTSPRLLVLDDSESGSAAVGPEDDEGRQLARRALHRLTSDGRAAVLATRAADGGGSGDWEAADSQWFGDPVRYGLLQRGRLAALGTARQLRNRFRHWLSLEAHIEAEDAASADAAERKLATARAVLSNFRDSFLLEDSHCWMQFCVPRDSFGKLSDALRWLADSEVSLGLRHLLLYHIPLDRTVLLQQLSSVKCDLAPDGEEEDIVK